MTEYTPLPPKKLRPRPIVTPEGAERMRFKSFELGEEVRVAMGFNRERLARLDVEELVDPGVHDRDRVKGRLADTLEVFSRLPRLDIQSGVTAIFGENGSGKTMLADVIVQGLRVGLFRELNGLSPEDDVLTCMPRGENFLAQLSGRTTNAMDANTDMAHAELIARIAQTMDVERAVLHSLEQNQIGDAMRTPVALGNIAMGMSSRQAVDYLDAMNRDLRRGKKPSITIYDEPELGMSPRRHMGLQAEIENRTVDGSIELVPSNSPVLYSSNVPRIDLEYPEKGVFTPTN